MKKILLSLVVLASFLGIFVSVAKGKDSGSMRRNAPESEDIHPNQSPKPEETLKRLEIQLMKREQIANNTASNSAEAFKQFQQKTATGKKQRLDCLKEHASEIKNLERSQKASGSAALVCSPKTIAAGFTRPSRPSLDGMSDADKKVAVASFSTSLKEYYTQIQTAMKTCRSTAEQTRLTIRNQIVTIKEQCSNSERTVLGLSTETPYNAQ